MNFFRFPQVFNFFYYSSFAEELEQFQNILLLWLYIFVGRRTAGDSSASKAYLLIDFAITVCFDIVLPQ